MSCFGCSRKYGLFCKENGCPNCGYSYCAKCLKRPVAVPRHGGKVLNVCLICYDKLSKQAIEEKVVDCETLPGTLITRAPPKAPNAVPNAEATDALFDDVPSSVDLDVVLAPAAVKTKDTEVKQVQNANAEIDENLDSVISKRLQNLKTVDANDDEIRMRLANLSGMPHQKNYDKKELLLNTDQRTNQEKIKELLEQFLGETQIDKHVQQERTDAISDIERRLNALRDTPIESSSSGLNSTTKLVYSPDTNTPSDNETEEDDETMLKKVMEKYLAEARLPTAMTPLEAELASSMPIPPPPGSAAAADQEELPWCNICNEDAVYRCHGCDGELFCAQCYRECHDNDEEYREHAKEKYTSPPKFKEDHF